MEESDGGKGRPGQDQAVQIGYSRRVTVRPGKKGSLAILARRVVSCTRTKIGSCVLVVYGC